MSRLFVKIWLWFWLATVLLGAALFLAQRHWSAGDGRYAGVVEALGRAGLSVLEQRGPQGFGEWRERTEQRMPGRLFLLGPDDHDVAGRPLPPALGERLATLSPGRPGHEWGRHGHLIVAPLGSGGYRVAALMPRAGGRFSGLPGWARLLIAVVVSGLVCLALAHYLTRPIRRIRSATQRLAGGDLGARVGPAMGRRRDEIAQLGHDFDRMAERLATLIRAQTQLLRDVSHELRSPLTRLQVALELARQGQGDDDPNLQRIAREAERLNELIGQVLALARYEAGGPPPRRHRLDPVALVAQVVRDADFEACRSGRRVVLSTTAAGPLDGDPALLRSAVENVVRNAVRYTAEGTAVQVLVEPDGEGCRVVVSDRGPGVPEADLERLFEPFVRVGAARDRESGGYGLGLAIARRAVQAHGGTIRAENRAGGGLVVTLRLPRGGGRPEPAAETGRHGVRPWQPRSSPR